MAVLILLIESARKKAEISSKTPLEYAESKYISNKIYGGGTGFSTLLGYFIYNIKKQIAYISGIMMSNMIKVIFMQL